MPEKLSQDMRDLAREFVRGDDAAIRRIDGWIDVVLRRGFTALSGDWDDLRQEIRIRLYRNLTTGRFDGRSHLRTYVHRIAKNVCLDFARHRRLTREEGAAGKVVPFPAVSPAAVFVARDLLEKILSALPEDDRLMIHLVFSERHSYGMVGRLLGIPPGTVKSRMHRCKQRILKLRRELSPGEEP